MVVYMMSCLQINFEKLKLLAKEEDVPSTVLPIQLRRLPLETHVGKSD